MLKFLPETTPPQQRCSPGRESSSLRAMYVFLHLGFSISTKPTVLDTDENEDTPKRIAPQSPTIVHRAESAPGPSYFLQPSSTPQPTVYNYTNPATGERIVSLLPPDHPEMVCLQSGSHVPETHFGLLGKCLSILLPLTTLIVRNRHSRRNILVPPRSGLLPNG